MLQSQTAEIRFACAQLASYLENLPLSAKQRGIWIAPVVLAEFRQLNLDRDVQPTEANPVAEATEQLSVTVLKRIAPQSHPEKDQLPQKTAPPESPGDEAASHIPQEAAAAALIDHPVEAKSNAQLLADIRQRVTSCPRCRALGTLRSTMVFSVGNPNAKFMLVGEAPGADEERLGEPFVGRAGQLLTRMLKAMGLERKDVYISNVVKYRPAMPGGGNTGNRPPSQDEIRACRPYLMEEIRIIQPTVILALGATSMSGLLGIDEPLGSRRGKFHDLEGTPVMVTYHPAYLLRNPTNPAKRKVWEDLLQVMEKLEMSISDKQRNYFLDEQEKQ